MSTPTNAQLKPTINPQRERQLVWLMVAGFVILAAIFSLGPIFEGPDEIEHYRYIRVLAQTGNFPDPYTQPEGELFQAPLYYVLATPLALATNDSGFEDIDGRRNPYHGYEIGIPSGDNKNVHLHTRSEAFPYRESGIARAVHILRLLSIAIGACTVIIAYAIFKLLWPDRPDRRLLALGFVAFMPQFAYMSSVISNDVLLYLLVTLSLLLLLRQGRDGPSRRGALILGVALGAALLTEVSAAFLAVPVGLATLLDRRTWRYAPLTLGVTLVVGGWWYLRNTLLYGDPTGVNAVLATWEWDALRSGGKLALGQGIPRVVYAYRGFWARFGYGAVAVGKELHWFFDGLTILSLIGLALTGVKTARERGPQAIHRPYRQGVAIVAAYALVWLAALVYWSSTVSTGNQGRQLLPAIAAWAALFALGLTHLIPFRRKLPVALGGVTLMAAASVVALFGYFLPAYRVSSPPETVSQPLAYNYGDVAELTGIDPPIIHAHPGDTVRVTLYWRALRPTQTELQAYLHSVDSGVVRRDSHPATGNLLSTDWFPGQTWAETYVIVIPPDADAQTVHPLIAGLYDPQNDQALPARDPDGNEVTPIVGRLAVNGPPQPFTPDYRFGDAIGLAEPEVIRSGDELELCARWLSLAPVETDYHVFVHVLAEDGEIVTQTDVEPRGGAYPTGAWMPGEAVEDCITLDVSGAAGDHWRVGLGLYDLETEQRLHAEDAQGQALVDNMLLLSE